MACAAPGPESRPGRLEIAVMMHACKKIGNEAPHQRPGMSSFSLITSFPMSAPERLRLDWQQLLATADDPFGIYQSPQWFEYMRESQEGIQPPHSLAVRMDSEPEPRRHRPPLCRLAGLQVPSTFTDFGVSLMLTLQDKMAMIYVPVPRKEVDHGRRNRDTSSRGTVPSVCHPGRGRSPADHPCSRGDIGSPLTICFRQIAELFPGTSRWIRTIDECIPLNGDPTPTIYYSRLGLQQTPVLFDPYKHPFTTTSKDHCFCASLASRSGPWPASSAVIRCPVSHGVRSDQRCNISARRVTPSLPVHEHHQRLHGQKLYNLRRPSQRPA